jgi:hypothetical protein
MSKRSAADPLLDAFFEKYKLNLLTVPRRDATVGDVYVDTGRGVLAPGRLQSFLSPPPKLPDVRSGEQLAHISTTATRALHLKVGLGLLEGFFSAIGASFVAGKVKAAYERNGADSVRFKLNNVTRDSFVDVIALGNALFDCQLNRKHPFVQDENKYYVTVGVFRSPSITVRAEDNNQNTVTVEAKALSDAVGVDGKINIKGEGTGELIYEGTEALAFGVELVELAYSHAENRFTLAAMPRPVPIRTALNVERNFIGDSEEGDAFIRIVQPSKGPAN